MSGISANQTIPAAQPTPHRVTTGLDPVVHVEVKKTKRRGKSQ
jgi:hypothetical protein